MKCIRTVTLSLLALAALSAPCAAGDRFVYFQANVGPSILAGPEFATDWLGINSGVTGNLSAVFEFDPSVSLTVRLEYHRLPVDDTSVVASHEALRVWMLGTVLHYVFLDEDAAMRPFLGLGYSTADAGWENDAPAEIETYFDNDDLRSVLQLSGGVQIRANDWLRVVVEGRYMLVSSPFHESSTTFYPITLGARF